MQQERTDSMTEDIATLETQVMAVLDSWSQALEDLPLPSG